MSPGKASRPGGSCVSSASSRWVAACLVRSSTTTSACPPRSRKYSAIVKPANGAIHCSAARSGGRGDHEHAALGRAELPHRLDDALDRGRALADRDIAQMMSERFWLMIVSTAIAVLPVARSPMMSSRWPRPSANIASTTSTPVSTGSVTSARSMIAGDGRSIGWNASGAIGWSRSSGRPSGRRRGRATRCRRGRAPPRRSR